MGSGLGVRSVTRADHARFEAAMTLAFSGDALARWAFPDPLQYLEIFVPLVTLFGGKSFDHGSAYVVGDYFGVAQWLPPDVHPDDGPLDALFEAKMSEPRLGELRLLFEQMASFHPEEAHWYLPLIGVDPIFQGRGYGAQMMQHALLACDRDHQIAYLEASSPRSRSLYERFGFQTIGAIQSADSPMVFPMRRDPQ